MTNAQRSHLVALSLNFTGPFRAQKSGINGVVRIEDATGKLVTTTSTFPAAQRRVAVMNGA